ncbi:hypothetical protein [Saccharopolyspora griseoalba]|uniref:Uncharacterized protein n=1 Tax=Saccharopolyspora griseoalba TaxID=1431848 RepID=A0ABW2LKX7_9PSEU
MLSDRAVALARRTGDRISRLSAEALAVFASNRLGRGVPATGRALAAVRDAESAGDPEVLTRLRIELAWCAGSAGSQEVALRILRAELERERIEPGLRAHALLAMAAALPTRRDVDERTRVLDEAERLYAGCASNRDVTRLLTSRVWAARAGHLRRISEFGDAVAAADAGLELLDALTDAEADGGGVRARLELERVQALLDLGRRAESVESAREALSRPVRAAEAGPLGWLGLALATRVHLPAGDHASAVRVLGETAAIAERHELDGLRAEALNVLSRAHESAAEGEAALRALREAYSADRRWRSRVHEARMSLLTEFPPETAKRVAPGRTLSVAPEPRAPEPDAPEPPRRRRCADPEPEAALPARAPEPEPAAEPDEPVESIEPDWAAFLGLAVDGESRGAEPEPVAEPEPEPEPVAEVDPSDLRGYAETQDAARRLLESLTGGAEQPEASRRRPRPGPGPAAPGPEGPELADPEPVEPAMPELRVEFAALSDQPPWLTGGAAGTAEQQEREWQSDPLPADPGPLASEEVDDELPGLVDDDPAPVSAEPRATATSLLEQLGIDLASYGAAEPEPEPAEPEPEPAAEEEVGGRRSRGKSLAEIRAGLDLPADHKPGRRRRYAEEPAAAQPEPDPAPEPEPSADAGLGDLLAEAMKAYEAGSREPGTGGSHRSPGAAGESTSDDPDHGPGARHRKPGLDTAAADPLR